MKLSSLVLFAALAVGCASPEGKGLRETPAGIGAMVRFDMFHQPLPEIPLPNDLATRLDSSSPTKRRLNVSLSASTDWEKTTRADLDALDGWSTYGAITVSFDKPLDVESIYSRHVGDDYDPRDDAVYVIDITPDSPEYCEAVPLDMGEGNFPLTLERQDYFPNDLHNTSQQLVFEENEEDRNGNGKLDLGEDLDMDGVLDHPNYRHPDSSPFDVMSFYERETNTLIMKPVMPMRENTTYAAVITRRLLDEEGHPVRSPFAFVNHTAQTRQLEPLTGCLGKYNLGLEDVAFTWPFTTQSISRDFKAIRDGLYGLGPMSRLAEQFPANVEQVLPVRDPAAVGINEPALTRGNVRVLPGDYFWSTARDLIEKIGGGKVTPSQEQVIQAHKFIDFHAVFTFESPQFFPRLDSDGQLLPIYRQTWNVDPVSGEAFVRPEKVTAWLTVPKNRKGPAPVVLLGHGYASNKLELLYYAGFFARHGLASVAIDCTSHGMGLDGPTKEIAKAALTPRGLVPFFNAGVNSHRAYDQDGDGVPDSGADFWTSFIFHTRDMVRGSTVDYMQLIRILRSFDGTKVWGDANRDHKDGLAGDFDGDGVVDVGGSAPIDFSGGSLGGIMSVMVGGSEPAVDVVVPVSGGAGLADIGVRSTQGSVSNAVNLRMMAPLLVTLKNDQGTLDLWQYVPNLNKLGQLKLAPIDGTPKEGDTAVVTNLRSKEYRCGRVLAGGLLRVAVSSDEGDPLLFQVFDGPLPSQPIEGCRVPDGAKPFITIDTLGYAFDFGVIADPADTTVRTPQDSYPGRFLKKPHPVGEPLSALASGLGLRRNSPEIRRFMGLAQMAVDRGDPVNFAPNFERRLIKYATQEEVHTRALVFNTIGDTDVPVATGTAISRAAGFIELRVKDPRWGKTQNRVLIDTGTIEGVERTHRWQNGQGEDVLMDIEDFPLVNNGDDKFDVPRLSPPFRDVAPSPRVGGVSGTLFPMVVPTGRHGFDTPDPSLPFDLGSLLLNVMGRYVSSGGRMLSFEACMVSSSCEWIPPIPPDPLP